MKKVFNFQIKMITPEKSKASTSKDVMATGMMEIEGFASTMARDRVDDIVLPEAFKNSIKTFMKNPIMLMNHDQDEPIGKFTEMEIQENGLYVKGFISKTRPDVQALVEEGVLSTFSIGYNTVMAEYDPDEKANVISDLELLEISIVSIPANHTATMQPAQEKMSKKELKRGDFVAWDSSGRTARGQILQVITDGDVPGIPVKVTGSKEDPAAQIRIYRRNEDGWQETDTLVGHKLSTLRKIPDLKYYHAATAILGISQLKTHLSYNINELVDLVVKSAELDKDELNQQLIDIQGDNMNTKQIVTEILKSLAAEEAASEAEEVKSTDEVSEPTELAQLVELLKNFIERTDTVLKYLEASKVKDVETEEVKAEEKEEKPEMSDEEEMKTEEEKEEDEKGEKEEDEEKMDQEDEDKKEEKSSEDVEENASLHSDKEKELELEVELLEEELSLLKDGVKLD